MLNRYSVAYVGGDSLNHRTIVWAKNHDEAIKKAKAKHRNIDMISGVRRMSNPFVIWGIAVAVALLLLIELVN